MRKYRTRNSVLFIGIMLLITLSVYPVNAVNDAVNNENSTQQLIMQEKKVKYLKGTSHYKKPGGKIAECTISERGTVTGGKRGDQNGEVTIKDYSYGKRLRNRNWKFVIRARDPRVANAAATFVKAVCKNDRIGYDNYKNNQKGINKRDRLYKAAKKVNFKAAKIRKKVDTSCTPLCMFGFCAAGVDMSCTLKAKYKQSGKSFKGRYKARTVNAESLKTAIRLVNKNYRKEGLEPPFRIMKLSPKKFRKYKKNLKRGDVLCTGHHTVMVL